MSATTWIHTKIEEEARALDLGVGNSRQPPRRVLIGRLRLSLPEAAKYATVKAGLNS